MWVPQDGRFVKENPLEMDDLGVLGDPHMYYASLIHLVKSPSLGLQQKLR